MNVTSNYYRTREGCPEKVSGIAERWMHSVRQAARVAQACQENDAALEPLRPSNQTLRRMERRFKH